MSDAAPPAPTAPSPDPGAVPPARRGPSRTCCLLAGLLVALAAGGALVAARRLDRALDPAAGARAEVRDALDRLRAASGTSDEAAREAELRQALRRLAEAGEAEASSDLSREGFRRLSEALGGTTPSPSPTRAPAPDPPDADAAPEPAPAPETEPAPAPPPRPGQWVRLRHTPRAGAPGLTYRWVAASTGAEVTVRLQNLDPARPEWALDPPLDLTLPRESDVGPPGAEAVKTLEVAGHRLRCLRLDEDGPGGGRTTTWIPLDLPVFPGLAPFVRRVVTDRRGQELERWELEALGETGGGPRPVLSPDAR